MSAIGERVPLMQAQEVAYELASFLAPACRRIEVAGSVRRQRADIGDIDLVCEPIVDREPVGLFGDTTRPLDRLHERCEDFAASGVLGKRLNAKGLPTWGPRLKRATYQGFGVDIQAVHDPEAWGFWLLIRTGPSQFNQRLVTPRHKGGLLPPGFEVRDGFQLYRHGGRVPTPDEESVFRALGLDYVRPEDRR